VGSGESNAVHDDRGEDDGSSNRLAGTTIAHTQCRAKTEFWGPKGGDRGTGPKGLADECMAKGYEIKVVPAKDATVAKDVYLPNRKPK
jgi:hypothetical protein